MRGTDRRRCDRQAVGPRPQASFGFGRSSRARLLRVASIVSAAAFGPTYGASTRKAMWSVSDGRYFTRLRTA